MIPKSELESLIPHAGAMCLLDAVVAWDDACIDCWAANHNDRDHPLAREGRLSSIHLIEYGAQAAAVHGGLHARRSRPTGSDAARPGMIVSVRDVRLTVEWIEDIPERLDVHASRLLATAGGQLYEFHVNAGKSRLAQGRIAILFGPPDAAAAIGARPGM